MTTFKVDPAQITRLTWKGNTEPNYGGNTFLNRVHTIVAHIKAGIATIEDYKCYTWNSGTDITEQLKEEVQKALQAPRTYTIEEIQRRIYKHTGRKTTVKKLTGSMKNYRRFTIIGPEKFTWEQRHIFRDMFKAINKIGDTYTEDNSIDIHIQNIT